MTQPIIKLTVTSPVQTFTEPLTSEEVRQQLSLPDSDTTRDLLITTYIIAVREVAEECQQRDLVSKQWDMWLSNWPNHIELREGVVSINTFRYRREDGDYVTMTATTDYIFDSALGRLVPPVGGTWPTATLWPTSAIEITFTVTAQAVREKLKRGMLFLITQWYWNQIPAELGASEVQHYPFMLSLLSQGRKEYV